LNLKQTSAGILVLLALSLYAMQGCNDNLTTTISEVSSPDGQWAAKAVDTVTGGPGNAGHYQSVLLRHLNSREEPTEVFGLDLNASTGSNLRTTWSEPTHLVISFDGRGSTVFSHTEKFEGIDIETRDTSR